MPCRIRFAVFAAFFFVATATFADGPQKSPQPKGRWDRFVDTVSGFIGSITGAGEVNPRCRNCAVTPQAPQLPVDKSIAWLQKFLKCDNFEYLKAQRNNLVRAERQFGVPAAAVACLIATESGWDINADQLNKRTGDFRGSFVGLVQSYAPTFEIIKNDILTTPSLLAEWNQYNPGMSPNILARETMLSRQGLILDCPIRRCGGDASPRDRERIARASIAFVSIYLRENTRKVQEFLRTSPQYGPAVASRFSRTQRSQYLAAAIGYNAGENTMTDYLPPTAFTQDNGVWRFQLRHRLPKLKRRLTPKDHKNAVAKTGEVVQYIDWINTCMTADQRVGPADRTAHLSDENCFGNAQPATIRKLLAVRVPPKPRCTTDPSPPCTGPNTVARMINSFDFLTPKQINAQSAKCPAPPEPPKGQVVCPI